MRVGQIRVFSGTRSVVTLPGVDLEVIYVMLGPSEEDENVWKAVILCTSGKFAADVMLPGSVCDAEVNWWMTETEELP